MAHPTLHNSATLTWKSLTTLTLLTEWKENLDASPSGSLAAVLLTVVSLTPKPTTGSRVRNIHRYGKVERAGGGTVIVARKHQRAFTVKTPMVLINTSAAIYASSARLKLQFFQ